jgi:aspartyl-tRNA(Asn)/glutamyl-tRNA(Gln) amidotransferase subunit A
MSTLPPNPFAGMTLAQYGAQLRRGARTASEVTAAYLERIEALNPKLGAYTFVAAEQALADARRIDSLLRSGTDLGPLMGVPVAVKDLYFVKDLPLTAGSKLDVSGIVREEGSLIGALRRSGAIMLGKTWTSEFALGGINFIQRVPWNPCDPEVHRTPGGSSGGSAVAMAAGLCAFALGTDTGGSVRMPAALCGVFGHKFSADAFPIAGIFPLSPTLDSPGVFTVGCDDAITVWQALGGSVPETGIAVRDLTLGVPAPVFHDDLDPEVARAMDSARTRLAQCGARIVPIEVPEVLEFEALFGRIVPAELIEILGRERVRKNLDVFDPVTKARFNAVLNQAPADSAGAVRELAALRQRVLAAIRACDAWITPTAPLVPGPLSSYDSVDAALAWNRRALRNTRPGNVFDQCGVSLPLTNAPLPVGLQILCAPMADAKLLAIARAVETAFNSPE